MGSDVGGRAHRLRPMLLLALAVTLTLAGCGVRADRAAPVAADSVAVPPATQVHFTFTGATSVAFDWVGGDSVLRYGLTTDYGQTQTAVEPTPLPTASAGPFREAELTGLEPDTEYHYAIGTGPDHTFRTSPAAPFSFVAVGDIGDSTSYPWITDLMGQIAAERPAFVLPLGDLTYANYNCAAAIDRHFDDVQVWSTEAAYMPVWGNHEYGKKSTTQQPCAIDDTFANYKGRFALPHPQVLSSDGATTASAPGCALVDGLNPCRGEDWYWFDVGPVRVIAGPEPFTAAVTEWRAAADTLMAEAQADPSIRYIVTASHRPAYSSSTRAWPDYRAATDALGQRYPKYVLHLNGHAHTNEVFRTESGVTHVTAGGGGEGLDRMPAPVAGQVLQLEHMGFAAVDVGASSISVRVVCGPDVVSSFADPCVPGETVASFDVSRTAPRAAWSADCKATTSCTFDASASSDPDGSVTSYEWDFGDGGTATGPAPVHDYGAPGVRRVRLTVTDDSGQTHSRSQLVTAGDPGAVTFRAARAVSARAFVHRITVPAAVRGGDGLLAALTLNNPSRQVTTPDGWSLVDSVAGTRMKTLVWQRVADASTAGSTVRFALDARAAGTTSLLAYQGTSAAGPVGALASAAEQLTGRTHSTPSLDLGSDGAPVVSYWSNRSDTTVGWEVPAQLAVRSSSAGTGTAHTSAVAADSGGPVPAGATGGVTATASSAGTGATTMTLLLTPGR